MQSRDQLPGNTPVSPQGKALNGSRNLPEGSTRVTIPVWQSPNPAPHTRPEKVAVLIQLEDLAGQQRRDVSNDVIGFHWLHLIHRYG